MLDILFDAGGEQLMREVLEAQAAALGLASPQCVF